MTEYKLVAYNGDELIHRSELVTKSRVEDYKSYLFSLGATVIEVWLIKGIIE
jgi:hypothetical protein